MATEVAGVIGWGVSDGETIDAVSTRHSTVSAFDCVHGPTPLSTRGGIIPAGGSPLAVSSLGTAQVQLKAGRCIVTPNSATTPPYGLTLTADTNLDVSAAHASLVRVDLIIAEIQDVGTSSAIGRFRVLQGTAGSGRPALPTTPSTTHCISLATITLPAAGGSTIQAGWISKTQSDTWAKTDSDATYTTGPGGTVIVDFASPSSLLQMSATRRQGFATLFAPGTRFIDYINRVEGFFDGSDICPTSKRTLVNTFVTGPSSNITSSTEVDIVTHSAFTLLGGTRRLKISIRTLINASAITGTLTPRIRVTGGLSADDSVVGTMTTTGGPGQIEISRTWSITASGTIAANTYKLVGRVGAGTGTWTGNGSFLLIEDEGPA